MTSLGDKTFLESREFIDERKTRSDYIGTYVRRIEQRGFDDALKKEKYVLDVDVVFHIQGNTLCMEEYIRSVEEYKHTLFRLDAIILALATVRDKLMRARKETPLAEKEEEL
jgi:hypothetical protein